LFFHWVCSACRAVTYMPLHHRSLSRFSFSSAVSAAGVSSSPTGSFARLPCLDDDAADLRPRLLLRWCFDAELTTLPPAALASSSSPSFLSRRILWNRSARAANFLAFSSRRLWCSAFCRAAASCSSIRRCSSRFFVLVASALRAWLYMVLFHLVRSAFSADA